MVLDSPVLSQKKSNCEGLLVLKEFSERSQFCLVCDG